MKVNLIYRLVMHCSFGLGNPCENSHCQYRDIIRQSGAKDDLLYISQVPVVMVSDPTVPLWAKQPYVTKLSC